jgi:uncharacterized membrane protein
MRNMTFKEIRRSKWFDVAYKIGVGIKGIDGLIELAVGLWLIFAPHTPHRLLQKAAHEAGEHTGTIFHFIGRQVVHLDDQITGQVLIFIIIFLIIHGIVKLVLVYCLFKKIHRVYPYALGVLLILFGIQVTPLFRNPADLALWLFTVLDVIIIYLVWGEYQDIKEMARVRDDTHSGKKHEKTV